RVPMRGQESRARPRATRSTLIWEIPAYNCQGASGSDNGGISMGRLIRQGCKGEDVRAIQDVLNFHIRWLTPLAVDGIFVPLAPPTASFLQIMRLLDRLPPTFPFRGSILGAVPRPVKKVGPLELDPVSPMNFGFQWGVKPVFDLRSIGPPVEFTVGGAVNAR